MNPHTIQEVFLDPLNREIKELRQEIANLKIANQDLKYQLIQKTGELVLADFDIKELEKEIEYLKSKVQYWKASEK
jgi:chromosome segregation ATPase